MDIIEDVSFESLFLESSMRKSFRFFFTIFLSLLCLGCSNAECGVEGYGEVYLAILDENGTPLPDSEAQRFRVEHNSFAMGRSSVVINEKDELIFSLGTIKVEYSSCKRIKKKEGFTDSEILNALNDKFAFSLKDIKEPPEYKTIRDRSYKSCFTGKFERTNVHPATYVSSDTPTHTYYCEIRLEKK